ncbi:MAG: hypothetical protein H6590_01060 [Flavobacteriales bacterium]|nr:hypothetical protein [Flavobacteriales bacterium]
MAIEYDIIDVFEITGRGAVVLIGETTDRSVFNPHKVELLKPDGGIVRTEAYKDLVLRRMPNATPVEKEGYLLKGLHKPDVPLGSRLRFVD